uniref:NADH-ubiquinone oxidoreductase chain 3 n=1 Tax=Cuspidaria undata TaxID=2952366 RepID=A0AAT9T5W2_9BIVA|nr:NADH dehydrogenase subunit 3 [Cuspidaria undata]USF19210.1 NADH dehydrogenase subunit 3 [Cuspidaria undata]
MCIFVGVMVSAISLGMGIIASMTSKSSIIEFSKNSSYECGFEPMKTARIPFSLRFFMLAVIFLVFDVEIALLFPLLSVVKIGQLSVFLYFSGSMFLVVLLLGLIHEWNEGSLNWIV